MIGSLRSGGAETYVANLAPVLRNYGIDMDICALERTGPLLSKLEKQRICVYDTPFPRSSRPLNSLRMLRTVDAIRRIVKAGRYDIVHTYLYSAGVLGVAAARLAGCRRIIISRQALHSWIHKPKAILHGLEQVANLFADELIACSAATLRDAEANERWLPTARTVIYNAVDVDAYEPVRMLQDGPIRLVTVGALARRKGQEYAIEALKHATAAGVQASLHLVGAGPDQSMLRRKVAEDGLERLVTFVGHQADPRPFLAQADVFLLPSRQEGFSVALLEAMASSMPAIATDVGGNAEALVAGKGGWIVPPEQPAAIAAAIGAAAGNRLELMQMGRFNRKRVADLFSIQASAQRLADWYSTAHNSSSPAALAR